MKSSYPVGGILGMICTTSTGIKKLNIQKYLINFAINQVHIMFRIRNAFIGM